jgi:putative ABC transport system permease protein
MFLTKLAFKNLIRHRNRTLITASIIAFAIFFYIVFDSLISGMVEMSYNSIIDYEAGHLQVMNEEYWEEEDELTLDNLMLFDGQVLAGIKDVKGYRADSPELNFSALLNNGINELPVIGRGIIPKDFAEVFPLENQFVEGSMFSYGEYKAVLGKRLADLLQFETGDYLTLLVKDKDETFNTIEAEVAGLIHTGNPNVNQNVVYLPLDLVQRALNVEGQVSKVIIRLENKAHTMKLAKELEHKIKSASASLAVYSWNELEAVSFAGAKQAGNQLILFIILMIAAIAIINTVILAALERMTEIGMMKAMGLRVNEIIFTFVLESTGIGVIGGIAGVLLGLGGVGLMARFGIDFAALYGFDLGAFGVPVLDKIYGVWNPAAFVEVFVFGVVASLLSSILPAYWAADKDPIKAIYHR